MAVACVCQIKKYRGIKNKTKIVMAIRFKGSGKHEVFARTMACG